MTVTRTATSGTEGRSHSGVSALRSRPPTVPPTMMSETTESQIADRASTYMPHPSTNILPVVPDRCVGGELKFLIA